MRGRLAVQRFAVLPDLAIVGWELDDVLEGSPPPEEPMPEPPERVPLPDRARPNAAQVEARTERVTEGDGRTRARYHGKPTRGRVPTATLDADDIRVMRQFMQRVEDGLALYRSPEVQALPRAQREDYRAAALADLKLMWRFAADMLVRHGMVEVLSVEVEPG